LYKKHCYSIYYIVHVSHTTVSLSTPLLKKIIITSPQKDLPEKKVWEGDVYSQGKPGKKYLLHENQKVSLHRNKGLYIYIYITSSEHGTIEHGTLDERKFHLSWGWVLWICIKYFELSWRMWVALKRTFFLVFLFFLFLFLFLLFFWPWERPFVGGSGHHPLGESLLKLKPAPRLSGNYLWQ